MLLYFGFGIEISFLSSKMFHNGLLDLLVFCSVAAESQQDIQLEL
jgi:hypothetical protein